MPKARELGARDVLEVVPIAMCFIRTHMRAYGAVDLSVPQFRSLLFISRNAECPLGAVAEQLGLTPPSMTKLIDGLERRGLVERKTSSSDRRRLSLAITPSGKSLLEEAAKGTRKSIDAALAGLRPEELGAIGIAMAALKRVLSVNDKDRH